MTMSGGDYIAGNFTGDVSGQVAVGKNISQTNQVGAGEPVTDAERAEITQLFAELRARIAAEAPPEGRQAATERVEELEEALTAGEPDLSTAQYVKGWFLKKLPTLAGLVTGVLVNPLVGKLVQSAGDAAATQLAEMTKE